MRRSISMLVVVFSMVSIAAIGFILGASMQPSRDRNDQMAKFDISGMKPGELRKFDSLSLPVWVLRRTPEMLGALDSDSNLLADPYSIKTSNPWNLHAPERAYNAEYFVFIPAFEIINKWNGVRSLLGVVPKTSENKPLWDFEEYVEFADNAYHGFFFDSSGRIFSWSRNQDWVSRASNLFVPEYVIYGNRSIVVNISTVEEQIHNNTLPR